MNNLIWIAGFIFSLPIFVFLGNLFYNTLKMPVPLQLFSGKRFDNPEISGGKITRRRIESNPNIVCGFPIQQQAREDAPLF
jgi:hypothetical protein